MRLAPRIQVLLLCLLFCVPLCAQSTQPTPAQSVPTTKVLAIGTVDGPLTAEQRKSIMPREVPETVRLYLNGKIDQWYVRKDNKGVVFLMNVTSAEEAHELLEQLPLGQAKLMKFELIELGPLNPLRLLLQGAH
jgi:hypothetical protein